MILDTLMVREFSPGWISLDITAAVEEWRKRWFVIWENHNKLAKLRRCASRVRGPFTYYVRCRRGEGG